jgi:hypothetical protein
MSTLGTIGSGTVRPDPIPPFILTEQGLIEITLQVTGSSLAMGQGVRISGDAQVSAISAPATQFPFGVASQPIAEDATGPIRIHCKQVVRGVANGGALTAGDLVINAGTMYTTGLENPLPNYVVAATGGYAEGIVIRGAAENAVALIGWFDTPMPIPAE